MEPRYVISPLLPPKMCSQADPLPQEIFLPSYVDCDYTPLENRREPVHEITLSEEEIKNMFPQ